MSASKKKAAVPVAPSVDARAIIASNIAEIATQSKSADKAIGSLLLTGVLKLSTLVGEGKASVDVGADYMLAYHNMQRAAKSQPLFSKVEETPVAARYGMVKLMRAAKEKPWFHSLMANVCTVHATTPIVITVLTEIGNRLFPKSGEIKDCPTVETLAQWRVDILKAKKGKNGAKPKAQSSNPTTRITAVLTALQGYETWLPALAHDHARRIVEECGTIVDVIKANPAKVEPAAPVDPVAAMLAKLAGK